MNLETKLLNRLKEEQFKFAVEALRRPQSRDAFEYGHRVGIMEGFDAAINVLLNLIDEDKYRDNDL